MQGGNHPQEREKKKYCDLRGAALRCHTQQSEKIEMSICGCWGQAGEVEAMT